MAAGTKGLAGNSKFSTVAQFGPLKRLKSIETSMVLLKSLCHILEFFIEVTFPLKGNRLNYTCVHSEVKFASTTLSKEYTYNKLQMAQNLAVIITTELTSFIVNQEHTIFMVNWISHWKRKLIVGNKGHLNHNENYY